MTPLALHASQLYVVESVLRPIGSFVPGGDLVAACLHKSVSCSLLENFVRRLFGLRHVVDRTKFAVPFVDRGCHFHLPPLSLVVRPIAATTMSRTRIVHTGATYPRLW